MIAQIIGVLVLFTALGTILYYTRIYGVDRLILVFTLIFLTLLILVSFPYLFRQQIQMGFIRPLDAFLTLTAIAALLMSLALYLRLRKTEQDLTRVIRSIALNESRKS